ncbi:hypothetical protein M513_04917 [Trichuris suis]|uniref:Uncharacterized protein n=2 Tax=Trichuris suis TaxID=68888 RepID=A0A085MA94_9BILA|nr:hypothetical protein M513_04917 [Trichuris suis]
MKSECSFVYEGKKTHVLVAEFEDTYHITVTQLGKFCVVVKVTSSQVLPGFGAQAHAVFNAKVLLGPDEVAFRVIARQLASLYCLDMKPSVIFFGLINPTPEYARCLLENVKHQLLKK